MISLRKVIKDNIKFPKLDSFKRYLFIGPHPDDIEFGCGGLISKLKKTGAEVHYLIVTDGSAGTDDPSFPPSKLKEQRYKEAKKAAEFMGVKSINFVDLEDGGDFSVSDVYKAVAPFISKVNPEIIFSVDPDNRTECHEDHLRVGQAIKILVQGVGYSETLKRHHIDVSSFKEFPRNIYLALYFTDKPNTYVKFSKEDLMNKREALFLHESQMVGEMKSLVDFFSLKALKVGKKHFTLFAEDYLLLHPIMQHVYSEGVNPFK